MSTRRLAISLLCMGWLGNPSLAQPEKRTGSWQLWFQRPAARWTEALPLGNGRLGAMVHGGIHQESIVLNEQTLYAGEPTPCGRPKIHQYVDQACDLLRRGRYTEADQLVRRAMTGRLHQSYMVLGHLRLAFAHGENVTGYRRSLDLAGAIAKVRYAVGNRRYRRQLFASAVENVLVIRLTCDAPRSISFTACLETPHHFARLAGCDERSLALSAKAPLYATKRDVATIRRLGDERKYPELFDAHGELRADITPAGDRVFYASTASGPGMTFQARIRAVARGGTVAADDRGLRVAGADEVTLLLAAKTSFSGFRRSPSRQGLDPADACERALAAAAGKSYDRLLEEHVADYRRLFDRLSIDLGPPKDEPAPTDRRVAAYAGDDRQLEALMFQYGRYLLIASSRAGGWPANLQGLWTEDVVTPWCGAFHLDVNLAMNYWPAEAANLGSCAEPLVDYIERLAANGRITAAESYRCRGWGAHIATSNKTEMDLRMAVYAAMVDEIDQGVGRIVETLRKHNLLDNTLLIFLSDNGACPTGGPLGTAGLHRGDPRAPTGTAESYVAYGMAWANVGNTPFRRYKAEVYEGGIASPLIVHWPAQLKDHGAMRTQVGHVIDLLPTCLEIAGAQYPASRNAKPVLAPEGLSLLPAFHDKPLKRPALYWEHRGNRAVRAGKWKLVAPHAGPWELYDIEADRTELHNVASQHADVVRQMTAAYAKWAGRCGVEPWRPPKGKPKR